MPPALGVKLASALYRLYPRNFHLEKTVGLIGARWVIRAIENGQDPKAIVYSWQGALDALRSRRVKYLLYPIVSPHAAK
jgi:hypothetical protein